MVECSSHDEAMRCFRFLNKKKVYNSKMTITFSHSHKQITFKKPEKSQKASIFNEYLQIPEFQRAFQLNKSPRHFKISTQILLFAESSHFISLEVFLSQFLQDVKPSCTVLSQRLSDSSFQFEVLLKYSCERHALLAMTQYGNYQDQSL